MNDLNKKNRENRDDYDRDKNRNRDKRDREKGNFDFKFIKKLKKQFDNASAIITIIQFKIAHYFIVHIDFIIVFIAFIIPVAFKSVFEFIINFNVLNKKVYKIINKKQIIVLFIITIMFSL